MQMIRNEIDRTRAEAGGFVAMVFVAAVIFAGLFIGGCAGAGLKIEGYRIDERQESVRTINQPVKCLWTECGGK